MTRTPFRRTAAALGVLLLAGSLAACGDDEPAAAPTEPTSTSAAPTESPSETPSETPSESTGGESIEGQGYTFDMPEGWQDGTDRFREMSPLLDTGAFDSDASNGFADNVNVIRNDTYPEMDLPEAERTFVKEAESVSEQVRVNERSAIGGETALHISGVTTAGPAKVRTEQYALYRDGAWYIVTFSFSEDTDDQAMQTDVSTVLGSWQWA